MACLEASLPLATSIHSQNQGSHSVASDHLTPAVIPLGGNSGCLISLIPGTIPAGGGGSPRNKAKVRVPKAGGNVLKSAGMLESKLKSQAQN